MAHRKIKRRFDIREYKGALRSRYRRLRREMSPELRLEKDEAIFQHVKNMPAFKDSTMVLCYVSMVEEINTHPFLTSCLAEGKTVGVPYCINGSREMDFYQIQSLDDLELRTFGVLEPIPEQTTKITDFSNAVCILPGLTFDRYGYRIGYGGGYYDRFLSSKFNGKAKIGVCYKICTRPNIVAGRYDVPCDFIVTEKSARPRASEEQHGRRGHKRGR